MHSEQPKEQFDGSNYTGKDILYREGAVGLFDVQRAADALLRQGRKPSVAGIREQLGGGSPNTITPLLAKYWQKLGERLGEGPGSLERVPEALARVTELLWRRALEEARERLKLLQPPDHNPGVVEALQEQIGKLSVALAAAKAREGEQSLHLDRLTRDQVLQRAERIKLVALLQSQEALRTKPFANGPKRSGNSAIRSTARPRASARKKASSRKAMPKRRRAVRGRIC